MGRDTWRHQMHDKEREKRKEINPVWRGIGCALMVVLSVGGYFFADWFLYMNETNDWFSLPQGLIDIPGLPWLPSGILIKLAVALVFLIVSFGLINLVYAVLFPIQPGKYDSPPLKPPPRRKT
jgi:multisubunit Na+/H+ antiporter MnhB subunit